MKQLEQWQGKFGKDYTERNVISWQSRAKAFGNILNGLALSDVLEVGCNRGHNLVALASFLNEEVELLGVEPNPHARKIARSASDRISAVRGTAYAIPFRDAAFDLVFTAGVLIHIPPQELPKALKEMARVSRRYLLAIEYYSEKETVVSYHGHDDLLWKRDFLKDYMDAVPGLKVVSSGDLDEKDGFDPVRYWLMEKTA